MTATPQAGHPAPIVTPCPFAKCSKNIDERSTPASWHNFPRKLTEPQVAHIKGVIRVALQGVARRSNRARRKPHAPFGLYVRLATEFGVSRSTIKLIRHNQRWRDVKPRRFDTLR